MLMFNHKKEGLIFVLLSIILVFSITFIFIIFNKIFEIENGTFQGKFF